MSYSDYRITLTFDTLPPAAELAMLLFDRVSKAQMERGGHFVIEVPDPVNDAISKHEIFRSQERRGFASLDEIAEALKMHNEAWLEIKSAVPPAAYADAHDIVSFTKCLVGYIRSQEASAAGLVRRVVQCDSRIQAVEAENEDLRRQLVNALERNRAAECSTRFAEMKALGITPEFFGKQTSKLEGARDDWAPESREVTMAEQWGEEFERQ